MRKAMRLILALSFLGATGAACFAGDSPKKTTTAQNQEVAGEYLCPSSASKAPVRLSANGNWGWDIYAGDYQIANGAVTFNGVGGPATWGPAVIGRGTLTFTYRGREFVYQKQGQQ